jgi:glycine oxidase
VSDVVIVGAGIVGCACAYELAKAGARVTVLEYGRIGMQATNAAAGMLAPLTEKDEPGPMFELGLRALREYPRLVRELQAEAGFDVEYRQNGILNVAFDDAAVDELRRRFGWQRGLGLPLEWLDGPLCREMEPRLAPRVVAGIFSPSEGSVSNQLLTLALSRAAALRGATFREATPVLRFVRRDGRVASAVTAEEEIACDALVLAAGARSGQLAARLGVALRVRPVRGQMIALGGMVTPVRHIVWGPEGYLVPRVNGLVFAGATVEDVGFRRRTTLAGAGQMRAMAIRLVPQLRAAKVHFAWAGLRPGSPDGAPIIGPLAAGSNVICATGHYRNGILLGPITGALVARGIASGDWSHVPEAFAAGRFEAVASR